jgi:long-subunit fatty acid transport protein
MIDLGTTGGRRAPTPGVGLSGLVVAGMCLAAWVLLGTAPAAASILLTPAVGVADIATVGTHIADPYTPSSALFENPAGLTAFDTFTTGGGLGVGYGRGRIKGSGPVAGYDDSTTMWPLIPDFGLSIPYRDRWRFAAGLFGTTGYALDFGPDPAHGIPSFFSETIIMAFPVGVGYRLTDQLSVGAEVQPLFGQLRTHFPSGPLQFVYNVSEFRYKINGPGVQGMVGVALRPNEQWAFGLGVRTPGMIWASGSMPVPGAGRQGVHCDLEMPTQVFLGATWRGVPRLALSGAVRFTNSSTLSSKIKYDLTPLANSGFIPDAHDEWKFGLGAEYAIREQTMLRLGAGWASHIVGAKGESPLVADTDDTKVAAGVGQRWGNWVVDLTAGYTLEAERHVPPGEALFIPGAYSMQGGVIMIGLMTHY